jgi:CBS-domain-containing membrane protein
VTRPAETAREDTPITEIAQRFAADMWHLAIVDAQGKLTGLVGPVDLIGTMSRMIDARTCTEPAPADIKATAA